MSKKEKTMPDGIKELEESVNNITENLVNIGKENNPELTEEEIDIALKNNNYYGR